MPATPLQPANNGMSYSHLYWETPDKVIEHLRSLVERDDPHEDLEEREEEWEEEEDDDDPEDEVVFHVATRCGSPYELVERMVERMPRRKVSKVSVFLGQTALHTAGKGTGVDVVQLLLEHDEGLLRVLNTFGWTFLHAAVKNGLDLDVIRFIVEEWPESATLTTIHKMTPLHFVGSETSLEVVVFLIDKWRGSVHSKDKRNNLPLHYAAANGAPLPVIQLLVILHPESVHARGEDGKLPLHRAAAGSTPDVVQYHLDKWFESIGVIDDDGNLPLHSAVTFEEEETDFVHESIEFSTPVRTADARGNVVRLLLARFPDSVQRRNGKGLFPMQLARNADSQHEFAVLGTLGEAWPESLLEPDESGRLPLHDACTWSGEALPELVQILVDRCPRAVRLRDRNGNTPLHLAVQELEHEELLPVVNILLDAWHAGTGARDATGRLPLHCAVDRTYDRLDLIQLLVERCPQSIHVPDAQGRIPLDCAIAKRRQGAVALLEAWRDCPHTGAALAIVQNPRF